MQQTPYALTRFHEPSMMPPISRFRYLPAYLLVQRPRFAGMNIEAPTLKGEHRLQNCLHEKKRPPEADAISLNPRIGARRFEPPTPWSRITFWRDRAQVHKCLQFGQRASGWG